MKAGNINYESASDLPSKVRLLPLSGALLLPGGQLPLNIFEPRYLQMFEDAVIKDRLIAMVQPLEEKKEASKPAEPETYNIGCVGRVTAFQESGDGRYIINLSGICRFKIVSKIQTTKNFQSCEVEYFEGDFNEETSGGGVDRERLLKTFRNYLDANQMDADWESVEETDTDQLVNALCMMSPYGPAEKQAMLEAEDIVLRAETLIAITEFELAKSGEGSGHSLQ